VEQPVQLHKLVITLVLAVNTAALPQHLSAAVHTLTATPTALLAKLVVVGLSLTIIIYKLFTLPQVALPTRFLAPQARWLLNLQVFKCLQRATRQRLSRTMVLLLWGPLPQQTQELRVTASVL
jgi:hypothetical protein